MAIFVVALVESTRNIDCDLIRPLCIDYQINLRHYQSFYTTSMEFLHNSNDIHQIKIPFLSKLPNIMFTLTVWHENFTVVKFYSSPLHRLDEKLLGF